MSHKKLAMLFIVTSLLTFATSIADAQDGPLAIVTEGLVSYWTFDELKKRPKCLEIIEYIVGDNDGILQQKRKVVEELDIYPSSAMARGTVRCLLRRPAARLDHRFAVDNPAYNQRWEDPGKATEPTTSLQNRSAQGAVYRSANGLDCRR